MEFGSRYGRLFPRQLGVFEEFKRPCLLVFQSVFLAADWPRACLNSATSPSSSSLLLGGAVVPATSPALPSAKICLPHRSTDCPATVLQRTSSTRRMSLARIEDDTDCVDVLLGATAPLANSPEINEFSEAVASSPEPSSLHGSVNCTNRNSAVVQAKSKDAVVERLPDP